MMFNLIFIRELFIFQPVENVSKVFMICGRWDADNHFRIYSH